MHILLVLAVVGSAVAAPQFAAPRTSFDPALTGFAPPVAQFATPVAPAPRFAAPTNTFNPQLTNFATPVVAGRKNTVYNLDSPAFLPTAGGFAQTRQDPQTTLVERSQYQNDNSEYGNSFKTLDGQHFSESGSLRPTNDHLDQVVAKQGSYGYISPEGVPVLVTYTADEYGFHPQSDILPQNVTPLTPVFV